MERTDEMILNKFDLAFIRIPPQKMEIKCWEISSIDFEGVSLNSHRISRTAMNFVASTTRCSSTVYARQIETFMCIWST